MAYLAAWFYIAGAIVAYEHPAIASRPMRPLYAAFWPGVVTVGLILSVIDDLLRKP